MKCKILETPIVIIVIIAIVIILRKKTIIVYVMKQFADLAQ